jgi:nitrogen-specific signal transduction histidine kinase/ActR/RegA family two-component response regulator
VRGEDGAVAWFEVIAQDLSERRALEQQLRQAQKMEAVGQLAGGIAHDFNNLLTTILGTLDLLEESDPGPEARRADLRDIRRAALRGAELTRKLLAFGRRQRLDTRTIDLGALAAEFMVMARRVVPENVELDFAIEHDCTVVADAGAIEQILLNLMTNARDATQQGGAIQVTIARTMLGDDRSAALGCRAGEYAEIRVLDTGQGMDLETQHRIFEPFFTTKPVEKGSGLGMAMVYGLVKQHKGGIRVESEPGLGSIVRVFLPLAPGRAAAEPRARAAAKPVTGEPRAPATILLVEDEEPLRRVAQRVLERFGFTVVTAGDGLEALELLRERPAAFDLVLTDMVMPRLGGVPLLEALRALRPDIRILCMSGYPARDTAPHGGVLENVPFLPKPWTMDGLIAKVDETLAAPVVT